MSRLTRIALGIVVGLVAWFAIATAGNLLLRATIVGYIQAEPSFQFTTPMLIARLALGAASSVVAGLACALVARSVPNEARAFAVALLLLFLPVHYGLWTQFPFWYHVLFLGSLVPLALLGARLGRASGPGSRRAA